MKVKSCLTFLFLFQFFLYSAEYKIDKIDDKIVVKEDNSTLTDKNFSSLINRLHSGDRVLFKRGKIFNLQIVLKNKENIFLGSYGNGSKSKISLISKIPFEDNQTFEVFYSKDLGYDEKDLSFLSLKKDFDSHYLMLSTKTKSEISKNFDEVKNFIDYIFRIKLPTHKFRYFDPNAIRVWLDGKELLKLMLFEELRCKDCGDFVRWYFEKSSGYLYLFWRGDFVDLDILKDKLKINNVKLDTIKITDSKNITISSLDIEGGKYAIALRGSSFVNIINCKIGRGSFVGVEMTKSFDSNASSDYNVIDNCIIDSGFKFKNYRFHSSRGSQDGIFLIGDASYNRILHSKIKDWGHCGINLFSQKGEVSNNEFILNKIDGANVAYMHGFTLEGKNCKYNRFFSNFFTNLGARNQLGGVENAIYKNYFANIFNSQIKKDQGYGSGQGVWLQTFAKGNYITDNIFIDCDEAAISLVSFGSDQVKEKNTISRNFIINCAKNVFNKPYKNCVIEIFDKNGSNVKNNNFINNKIFANDYDPNVYYYNRVLSILEFNEKMTDRGNFILGNILIK